MPKGYSPPGDALPIAAMLARYGLVPRKELGQHFLVSRAHLDRMVEAAELSPDDLVLEVGAGLGTLTERLARLAGGVIALELDERFIPPLKEVLAPYENVHLLQGDILKTDIAQLLAESGFSSLGYKVVANLPYYATSAILRHLLEGKPRPHLLVVTVQEEVAERMVARPGAMRLLSVSVQFYGHPQIVGRIPKGAFYPRPEVDSAIVRVAIHPAFSLAEEEVPAFFRVVRAGFAQSRKILRNSLAAGLGIPAPAVEEEMQRAGFDPHRRAQELGLPEWLALYRLLAPCLPPGQPGPEPGPTSG